MRKRILIGAGVVAVLVALYAGFMWLTLWRYQVTTDNAAVQADIAPIAAKLSGYVATVDVGDNQRVQRGDVLMTIDTSDIVPRVEQARAAVAAKEAAIKNAEARLTAQRSLIAEAEANVKSADADAARSRRDFARYQSLSTSGYVSKQQLDLARADTDRGSAAAAKARAALAAERDQVTVIETSKAQAEAELNQARAQLALAESDLANSKIAAPIAGVVGNRTVRPGQYVRAGAQVMVVVPLPQVYVVANFKETQLAEMRRGQTVSISIDALPGITFEGRVDSFSPASGALFSLLPPENATGNYTKIVQRIPVKIMVAGAADKIALLKPGMSAAVTVDTRDAGESQAPPSQNAEAQH